MYVIYGTRRKLFSPLTPESCRPPGVIPRRLYHAKKRKNSRFWLPLYDFCIFALHSPYFFRFLYSLRHPFLGWSQGNRRRALRRQESRHTAGKSKSRSSLRHVLVSFPLPLHPATQLSWKSLNQTPSAPPDAAQFPLPDPPLGLTTPTPIYVPYLLSPRTVHGHRFANFQVSSTSSDIFTPPHPPLPASISPLLLAPLPHFSAHALLNTTQS